MREPASDKHIHDTFAKLAHALHTGDVGTYRELVVGPDPYDEERFLALSLKLRDHGYHVRLDGVRTLNERASIDYALVDSEGHEQGHGDVTLVQESLGWYVDGL